MQKSRLKLLSVLITVILLISSSSYALEGLQEKAGAKPISKK